MKHGRPGLFGKLFRTVFLSSAAVILGVLFFSGRMMLNRMEEQFSSELLNSARFTAAALSDTLGSPGSDVHRMVASVKQNEGFRLTVVTRDGLVLADSDMVSGIEEMKNHASRPEIQAVLVQGMPVGETERYSVSVKHHMRYLAVPVKSADGKILGVCRVARSMESVLKARDEITGNLGKAGVAALFFCGLVSWGLSRRITGKVRELTQTIQMVRAGDLGARIILSETADTALLSEEFDLMLNEFKSTVNELRRERTQFHAVLDGMTDGIIAVDASGIVLLSNSACRTILGIEKPDGKMIQERIRVAAFNKLLEDSFREEGTLESDLLIPSPDGGPEKNVLAHAVGFAGGYPRAAKGVLVVLTDVTRLRQLENMRRDFAANVSHELRTPVTAILGFVETLLNGAIDEPENSRRFLKIIHAHTYRLGALINDIMALARIERDYETCQSEMTILPLHPFLLQVEETWRNKSAAKNIRVVIECPEELSLRMNDGFFVQAVGNLLDNAVTYSPENSEIIIRAGQTEKEVFVQVQDFGRGIPAEHLPRIFERFYTVDKARSRANGGTGLGLAIVKHIVQIHGGSVSVESLPNQGTTFTLHFPIVD